MTPVAVAATKPDDRHSLALINVTQGEGVTERQAHTIEELLLSALDGTGLRVTGRSDIDAVLTLEAKKEALNCGDNACMVQIAGALGADYVATADVGRLGTNTLLSLKVIDVRTLSVVRAQETVQSDNDLPKAALALAAKIGTGLSTSPGITRVAARATRETGAPTPMRLQLRLGWGALAAGVAVLAAGVGLGVVTANLQHEEHTTPHPAAAAVGLMNSSNSLGAGADAAFAIGGAFTAVGVGCLVAF
jgi:hypothetical protein